MQERKPDMQENPTPYPKKERVFLPRMIDGSLLPGSGEVGLMTKTTLISEMQKFSFLFTIFNNFLF